MVTSKELSKKLWEKGLRLETEKWYIPHGNIKDPIEAAYAEWRIEYLEFGLSNGNGIPAPSTDELLAVMPDETAMTKRFNQYAFTLGTTKVDTSPAEALGELVSWLLDNGYHYNPAKKMLVK